MKEQIDFDKFNEKYIIFSLLAFSLLICILIGTDIIDFNYCLLFLSSGLFLFFIFKSSKLAIYVILFSVSFFDFLNTYIHLPRQLTWLPEIMILILFAKAIHLLVNKKTKVSLLNAPLLIIFLLLIFIGLVSSFANNCPLLMTIFAYRTYLKYLVLFFLLLLFDFDIAFYKKIINTIFIIAAIQIPVALIEWKFLGAGDFSGGTFGLYAQGTGIMVIFVASIISIVFGICVFKKVYLRYILLSVGLFIPIITGESKAAFIFIPFVILFHLFSIAFNIRKSFKRKIRYALLLAMFIPIFSIGLMLTPRYFHNDWAILFFKDPRLIYENFSGEVSDESFEWGYRIKRISSVPYSINFISRDELTLFLGLGPGNASKSFFEEYNGGYSDLPVHRSALVLCMLEWGVLGTILYLIAFLYIFMKNKKIIRIIDDPYWKGIFFGFSGVTALYPAALIYNKVWLEDVLGFMFWFLASAIFVLERKLRINKANKQ
jgi:hypothetical protein